MSRRMPKQWSLLNKEDAALVALIERYMFHIRGRRTMLSVHLARLYGTEPRVLMQAVRRNKDWFPHSFAFQLNADEFSALKSQFVISEYSYIRRSLPYAFTEQGMVMLAGILRSRGATAMDLSIGLIRVLTRPHRPYLKAKGLPWGLW